MSHISKIELVVNDLAALKEACQNLGFEFREGQRTVSVHLPPSSKARLRMA